MVRVFTTWTLQEMPQTKVVDLSCPIPRRTLSLFTQGVSQKPPCLVVQAELAGGCPHLPSRALTTGFSSVLFEKATIGGLGKPWEALLMIPQRHQLSALPGLCVCPLFPLYKTLPSCLAARTCSQECQQWREPGLPLAGLKEGYVHVNLNRLHFFIPNALAPFHNLSVNENSIKKQMAVFHWAMFLN